MPRIPLAESMPDELGELFAAATNGRQPPLNLHIDSMLAVAREAAQGDGRVTGAAWRAATDAGVTGAQLAESYASIGLAVYVDRFVSYADTPFDVPAAATQAA